ncbi:hypothetical protein IV203_029295 [Nitzschia inconspicua]|uniref:Uncharacterized protein n=1 Tax=Nitzschia inconspicua TaxID=303405 RepID=A0A9K3Q140_9STRA|nr:hypothetical protein IV203_029295 [Nitzschia inconspicua]
MVEASTSSNENLRGTTSRNVKRSRYSQSMTQQLVEQQQHRLLRTKEKNEEETGEELDEEEVEEVSISTSVPSRVPTSSPSQFNIFTPEGQEDTTGSITTATTTTNDDDDEHVLLPFTFQVQGTRLLETTNEIVFRWHLQEYLLKFFTSPLLEVSNVLESIQLDRPWTTTVDVTRRELQDDEAAGSTTTSDSDTTDTQNLNLAYHGRAILKDAASFFDTQPTLAMIQEAQIVALEDTQALQEYFVQLLFPNNNEDAPNNRAPLDPVIFTEVQVEGRPLQQLDPAVTWDRIKTLNSAQPSNGQDLQQQPQGGDNSGAGANNQATSSSSSTTTTSTITATANSSEPSGLSDPAIAVIIAMALIVCSIAGGLLCMQRARHQRNLLTKLPGAPDVHAMEVVSDVDSEEGIDDIVYDKSLLRQQKNSSPTVTRTSSWCEEDDVSNTGSKKKGLTAFGRVSSLFRKSSSKQSSSNDIIEEEEGIEAFSPIVPIGSTRTNTSSSKDEPDIMIFSHVTNNDQRLSASSPFIDLTAPGRNSSGIEVVEKEAPKAAPRSVLSSPSQRSQKEHDELDSVVAKINLHPNNDFDEDSMMGYSLASVNDYVTGNNRHQRIEQQTELNTSQETEVSIFTDGETISSVVHESSDPPELSRQLSGGEDADSSNSDPSNRMSMFPGVQNLLRGSAKRDKPKNKSKKWYQSSKKYPSQGLVLSSDSESISTLDHVQETKSDSSGSVFIEDDAESVEVVDVAQEEEQQQQQHPYTLNNNPVTDDEADSSYKELESLKESDSSVVSDAENIANINGTGGLSALGYYKHSEADQSMNFPQITPAPSEEMDDTMLHTPVRGNYGMGLMSTGMIPDDVSDAPSDERNTNIVTAAMRTSLMDGTIRHTPSVDSDPAVVDYLMKERRQRTRRKRALRKQPPLTMEV